MGPSFKQPCTQDLKLGISIKNSSSPSMHNYFVLSSFLTNSQNFYQCLHGYDQQQGSPIATLQKPP